MYPHICRCCGQEMAGGISAHNRNVCTGCDSIDWDEAGREPFQEVWNSQSAHLPAMVATAKKPAMLSEVPSEMSQFVEMDEPSVIECLEAELAAKKAIADVLAKEIEDVKKALSSASNQLSKA